MEQEREREQLLYRMQAELCQTLADPTRLELLSLLGEGPKAVKDLVALLGQRQAKVSQHLALLRQRGMVRAERVGNEMHYALVDARILEACHITREILLQQLTQQGMLATMLTRARES
jgi:DNA-binding transcriptional ArsR family regulator